jgi:hypothetical protein
MMTHHACVFLPLFAGTAGLLDDSMLKNVFIFTVKDLTSALKIHTSETSEIVATSMSVLLYLSERDRERSILFHVSEFSGEYSDV